MRLASIPIALSFVLAAAPAASAWTWDGNAWADYSAFMSPITQSMKDDLQAVEGYGASNGRIEGRMGQIGDSITESSAFFRNVMLNGPSGNETGSGAKGNTRSGVAHQFWRLDTPCCRPGYR